MLEVTEATLLDHAPRCAPALHELHALGVQLCVDDFGARHTSLRMLRDLPVSSVKIDRSFVSGLGTNATTRRSSPPSSRSRTRSARSHRAGNRHGAPALGSPVARLRPRPGLLLRVPAARRDRAGARAPPPPLPRAPLRRLSLLSPSASSGGGSATPSPGLRTSCAAGPTRRCRSRGRRSSAARSPTRPRARRRSLRAAAARPVRGHAGSPCSRRPRHSAHGQLTRSSSSPNTVSVPSAQRTVRPDVRSSSTRSGDGFLGQVHRHGGESDASGRAAELNGGDGSLRDSSPTPRSPPRSARCRAGRARATRSSGRSSARRSPTRSRSSCASASSPRRPNHHPDLDVRWRKVRVALTTHDAGGLTAARRRPRRADHEAFAPAEHDELTWRSRSRSASSSRCSS